MYRVLACIATEHNHALVAVAALVCMLGSGLTVQLSRRMMTAKGMRKRFQMFLAALIGGVTIWSTHFIAMLAYEPGVPHGYEPMTTAMSLVVAVAGLFGAMLALAYGRTPINYLGGGGTFGMTVSVMHYVGMSAYELPGFIVWNTNVVFASILLGAGLGAAAFHRIAHPATRYCWVGGTLFMVLAICAMHFTAMSAITIELSSVYAVPDQVMSEAVLSIVVFGITALFLCVGFVGLNIEKDVERQAVAAIHQTAAHDALTGLPNRILLGQTSQSLAERLDHDENARVAALTIDLNLFKEVNDLHGHAVGDAVLIEISQRLKAVCAEDEFIARTGGDEFVALKSNFRRLDEVKAFAERLSGTIVEPIQHDDLSLLVTCSIGVATTLEDARDVTALIQKSDLAMYRAKTDPARDICFFRVELDQQNRDRLLLVSDLRQALSNNEFALAFQLQNDVLSRAPSGFEVLLRWNHPTRGRVSPVEFIPLAEETGLIREIGFWVLREACRQAATWRQPFAIAVNVAPQQLAQPSFVANLADVLDETGLDPHRLELEVTEASIIDDQSHALRVMHQIKAMGVRIAMDDFGTGYSSLATLQAFPFDKIKIDRSFIKNVHVDHQRAAIVRSTLLLGDALHIPVLAEGVEYDAELEFLRVEKCKYVQGFLFGKPMSQEEIAEIVGVGAVECAS